MLTLNWFSDIKLRNAVNKDGATQWSGLVKYCLVEWTLNVDSSWNYRGTCNNLINIY